MRHNSGSAIPKPVCSMSRCTSSGGLKKPPLGPTVRIVQKSPNGFEVAPAPLAPGAPNRPLTASIVRAPLSCALMAAAVAAPPPPTINTSVSKRFMFNLLTRKHPCVPTIQFLLEISSSIDVNRLMYGKAAAMHRQGLLTRGFEQWVQPHGPAKYRDRNLIG